MGQAKIKRQAGFAEAQMLAWEAKQCVNFAVALARITQWLLQVDWWVPSTDPNEDVPIERFKPLRVYVADSADKVFDVRGVRDFVTFTQKTVMPIGKQYGMGGLRTRFYSEASLSKLPLIAQPSEEKVAAAMGAIQANKTYLAGISVRPDSAIPAHLAAQFALGHCVPFAEALRESTGLKPAALMAVRYAPYSGGSPNRGGDGYFHSVVVHPGGRAEDSWGITSAKQIAERFGVQDYEVSTEKHNEIVAILKRNSPDRFNKSFLEAKELIATYRTQMG